MIKKGTILNLMFLATIFFSFIPKCIGKDINCLGWLNQHYKVKNSIKWNLNKAEPFDTWSSSMQGDLQTCVNQLVNGNYLNLDELPTLLDFGSGIQLISQETAWRYYTYYLANSIVTDELNLVPWKLDDLSEIDLDAIFNSKYMFTYSPDYKNFYENGVTPASPQFVYSFLEKNSLIGPTRYNTICRVLDWCKKLMHFGTHPETDPPTLSLWYIHWQYEGDPPAQEIIDGTIRIGDDMFKINHYTAGCSGTVAFIRSLLQTINIPELAIRCAGHTQAFFTSESVYLCHGDDPYSYIKYSDVRIPTSELLVDAQTYQEWFGPGVSEAIKLNHISYRTQQLGVKYLSPYFCQCRCDALQDGISNQEFMQLSGLSANYTLEDLNSINFWNDLDNKINSYGGCSSNNNFLNWDNYFPDRREDNDIVDIWFDGQFGTEQIDLANKKIIAYVKADKDIKLIVPHISISEGATISPYSGTSLDFTNKVLYEVKAENNTKIANWELSINYVNCQLSPVIRDLTIQDNDTIILTPDAKYCSFEWNQPSTFDDFNFQNIPFYYLSELEINGSSNENNQLKQGTVILYKTSENRYGKFEVLESGQNLKLKYITYDNQGNIYSSKNELIINGSFSCDLDNGLVTQKGCDFLWHTVTSSERYLVPKNRSFFTVYNDLKGSTQTMTVSNQGIYSVKVTDEKGCSKIDNYNVSTGESSNTLSVWPTNRYVTRMEGTTTFDIKSNSSWTIVSNVPWLSISPSSGYGNAKVTASFTDNALANSRISILTINGTNGYFQDVKVIQYSNLPPDKPILLSPGDGSTLAPPFKISWECTDPDINDELNYILEIKEKESNVFGAVYMQKQTYLNITGSESHTFEWYIIVTDGKVESISDTWQFTVSTITKAMDINKNYEINIYPNPAKEFLTIDFGMNEPKKVNIELFDITGIIIYKESIKSTQKYFKQINILDKKPGVYIVKIMIDNALYFRKIIIE